MERPSEPDECHGGKDELGRNVDDRTGQVGGQRGGDQQCARQHDGDRRAAGDAEGGPVADRCPVAEREGAGRRPDRPGRDDRQRDRDGEDAAHPREWLSDRRETTGEQVERARDHLRPDERDRRGDPERRAVEDVVVAPVAEQDQRTGQHRRPAEEGNDHPERDDPSRSLSGRPGRPAAARIASPKTMPQAMPHTSVKAMTGDGVPS